jgi:integrase
MKEQECEWVTPHIMRHTFATLLASMDPLLGGPSDFEIATWMGIDLRTYQRTYAKLRPRRGALDKAFHFESNPGH